MTESPNRTLVYWGTAAAVATLATWIIFDSYPGINWIIWTTSIAAGLMFVMRDRPEDRRPVALMAATAVIISGGAALSANPVMHALIFLSVSLFFAMAMLLASAPTLHRITAAFTVTAPIVAAASAVVSAIKQFAEGTQLVRSTRARSTLRGIVITLPVLVIFALLLSVADPTFATWRSSIEALIGNWDFLPRSVFFLIILVITLGAYAYSGTATDPRKPGEREHQRWLGSGERLILIGGVTGLLWLFMAVQLSYLFGNLPRITGSGMTFAEYARRGFGELTIVASASALIIIASERFGVRDARDRFTRPTTFALIIAVLFLLGSAFNRVLLYENAYGFTTARLYAQAFMVLAGAALLALSIEVAGSMDAGRLFRRVLTAATVVFLALVYWNHEAWIARQNIERFAVTGKLDARYLARELSPDALPTIVSNMARLPEPTRSELRIALERRYRGRITEFEREWYERNLSYTRALPLLKSLSLP